MNKDSTRKKSTIAIAGASGFIGRWFIDTFRHKFNIIAISRGKLVNEENSSVEWRQADLYSIGSTTSALAGADFAIYLVHSMMPSTRLNQSSFEDTDLILADNFSRACEINEIQQILYVGGILPKDTNDLSPHLRSRLEVEQTLGSRSTPLTAIRAGIIVSPRRFFIYNYRETRSQASYYGLPRMDTFQNTTNFTEKYVGNHGFLYGKSNRI